MKKHVRLILTIVLGIVFLVSTVFVIRNQVIIHKDNKVAEHTRKLLGPDDGSLVTVPVQTPPDASPEPVAPSEPDASLDPVASRPQAPVVQEEAAILQRYVALYLENPDTIGWLKLEDSKIDYVVMHAPYKKDKYLRKDFNGNYSKNGTLYLAEKCNVDTSDNLIIHGHRMNGGGMFGELDKFAKKSYWETHRFITFDTIYEERTYEVVAAFYTRILRQDEEGFRYYNFTDAADEEAFNEYVTFIEENQAYDTGVDIQYGDQLLTLSTCAYQTANGRFVVVAKRVTPDGGPALEK